MLIDVFARPAGFSFADAVSDDLGLGEPPTPPPFAVSYRVGEPVPEGTLIARWVRPLRIGDPLSTIPLALNVHQSIAVDLESWVAKVFRKVADNGEAHIPMADPLPAE